MRCMVIALLAGSGLLFCGEADAQPRQPPPAWKDPAGPPAERDVWLRRLVGTYSVEGLVHVPSVGDCGELPPDPATQDSDEPQRPPVSGCETVQGMGNCVGVGSGPGVQCVFNVWWRDLYNVDFEEGEASAMPGAVSYLNPAMALFGLDPGNASINHLLVDNKGLPEGGLGTNTGNRATFRTSCVNQPGIVGGCERIFRIEARANSRLVYMWIDVEMETGSVDPLVSSITLSLRRVSPDEALETPVALQR